MTGLILRGTEDADIWTCPICGNVNRGLYYSHEAPCPKCGEFRHPKLDPRTGYPRLAATTEMLEGLRSGRTDLKSQVEGLRGEICELEKELSEYDREIKNTEAILSGLRGQRSQSFKEGI